MDLSSLSNRKQKRKRLELGCYETKATQGFKGDRKSIEELKKVLGHFSESKRPKNEAVFFEVFEFLHKAVKDKIK